MRPAAVCDPHGAISAVDYATARSDEGLRFAWGGVFVCAGPRSCEDDADGEEEDYETAMKKLTEKAGDL